MDPDDMERVMEINNKRVAQMEKTPENYFKTILMPHIMAGSGRGLLVVETNDEQHLSSYVLDYFGIMDIEIELLLDTTSAKPTI